MSRRGFTMYELMVSVVMIALLAGMCATTIAAMRDNERLVRGYAEDLRHVRDASDLLAARIRAARTVEATAGGLRIDGELWAAADGSLLCDGEVAVRGVSRVEVATVGAGLWRVGVAPVPRREGARAPALRAVVRQRPEAVR